MSATEVMLEEVLDDLREDLEVLRSGRADVNFRRGVADKLRSLSDVVRRSGAVPSTFNYHVRRAVSSLTDYGGWNDEGSTALFQVLLSFGDRRRRHHRFV